MARNFSSSTDKVDLGYIAALDNPSSFWLAIWLNMDVITQDGVMMSTFENSGELGGWLLFFDDSNPLGDNRIDFFMDTVNGNFRVGSTNAIVANEWHHWRAQYDSVANEMRLYKDAVLDNTTTSVTADPNTSSESIFIGLNAPNDSGTRELLGSVADPRAGLGVLTVNQNHDVMHGRVVPGDIFHLPFERNRNIELDTRGRHFGNVTGTTTVPGPTHLFKEPRVRVRSRTAEVGGTTPHYPFGHPFYGPFAGPLAA